MVAGPNGSVEVPLTAAEEAAHAADDAAHVAGLPARMGNMKRRQKERMYDKHGSTVSAIIEALVEDSEGRPQKLDAIKSARATAKADPDWPG
jgi:hypothetical protein